VKTAVGSELSLVSGTYHENKVSVVMEMASFSLKIRHVFGNTLLQCFHFQGNFLF
jgi:hypothetical protein